jgi:putative cell wall-binding protein
VYLVGGTAAVGAAVDSRLKALGYATTRLAGANRFETAVAVADELESVGTAFLTTGANFPDALSAGAAAASTGGAVLLTDGDSMPSATRAWLDAHPSVRQVTIGGPAGRAAPSAEAVSGPDRYATAVAVAQRFFPGATSAGIASGQGFADALAAGPHTAGRAAPLLLSAPMSLPAVVQQYLAGQPTPSSLRVYGGTAAISAQVESQLSATRNR